MLAGLSKGHAPLLAVFLALRFGDLAVRGQIGRTFALDRFSAAFWIEIALAAAPPLPVELALAAARSGNLFRAAMS